jgi:CheY-like chemotaxis protein
MINSASGAVLDLLLVDDDDADALMVSEALAESEHAYNLHTVTDGARGVEYLHDPAHGLPDLIILDLNMPRMDGREFLAHVKNDVKLKAIPVVVLTTSEAPEDVHHSYVLRANAYVTKPTGFDDFFAAVHRIGDFFFEVAQLPRPPRG